MTMEVNPEVGIGLGDIDADQVLLTENGARAVSTPGVWPRNAEHQTRMVLEKVYELSGGTPGVALDLDIVVMSGNIGGPGIVRRALNRLVDYGFVEKLEMPTTEAG